MHERIWFAGGQTIDNGRLDFEGQVDVLSTSKGRIIAVSYVP